MQNGHVGLSLTAPRRVAGGVPSSAITSLEILGATPLLDATGDYGDPTARVGENADGWVAKVTVPYLVGQTFDPTKISLTVTDPGYDATGTTTVTRTITGTAILRLQYTAGAVSGANSVAGRQQSNDGITLTVYFALSDDIYDNSTITAGSAASGFYATSTAGAIASITNSSTLAYEKPTFAWLNRQHERATTSTFNVEAVAVHRRMRNGRQVARIEFIATDASAHTAATVTASTTSLSAFQTQGNIVECYKGTIDLSTLTQADLCLVNAKVYPWLGDSTAVLDLLVDGLSTSGAIGTGNPQTPLRFCNDKSGTYGGAHVAVQIGGVGTVAQATYAAAVAAPLGSINAALTALQTYNNANKGHNDHSGGTIWLMETTPGAGADLTTASGGVTAGMSGVAAGKCWTDIKVDPAASGAVKVSINTNRSTADLLSWQANIDFKVASNGLSGAAAGQMRTSFENITMDFTGNAGAVPLTYQNVYIYYRNVTTVGISVAIHVPSAYFGAERMMAPLILGWVDTTNTYTSGGTVVRPYAMVGCNILNFSFGDMVNASNDTSDGMVVVNHSGKRLRSECSIGFNRDIVRGFGILQCVLERAIASTANPALSIGGDGGVRPIKNGVIGYVTIPGTDIGSRLNWLYTDVVGAVGVIKSSNMIYSLPYEYNIKTDTFTVATTSTGRVGNWRNRYHVGDLGNVGITGDNTGVGTATPSGNSWLGEFIPSSCDYKVTAANVGFVSNLSGTAGAGNGDYHLVSAGTNAAYARVPSGFAGLAYDLGGAARLNDGNGAAGAYERP